MRSLFPSIIAILLILPYGIYADTQTNASKTFTTNLSVGSSGTQVLVLQKFLNKDTYTRIANSGPGSPGNETDYFGILTKSAVIRFQEKYISEVLTPVGLSKGNGYVGSYTRAKLNSFSTSQAKAPDTTLVPMSPQHGTGTTTTLQTATNFLVKDNERVDIYAGDKMIASVQNKIATAINSSIASQSTATITPPMIKPADVPSVVISEISPRSGIPGTRISIAGFGIPSNIDIYFGSNYIIRKVSKNSSGNLSFIVPPIPPARYDVAIKTNDTVSNTVTFVIKDPRNPTVHIQKISPSAISYGGTITIIGSGFSVKDNVVVTRYQKFTGVPSSDGKTLIIQLAPENLKESAKIGDGTRNIPMSLYVVNDYGFSDSEKSFTMTI